MSIAPITEAQRKIVKNDIKMDDEQMENKVKQLRDWMKKQPHLPQLTDEFAERMIYCFLVGTKMSTEKAKYKLDMYYAMRHQLPEIYTNRDPTLPDVRESGEKIYFFPLPELTPECIRVQVIAYSTDKNNKFTTKDLMGFYKRMMAVGDARMKQGDFTSGEYVILDCRGMHSSHLTELPWAFVQRFTALVQDGLPIRQRGVFAIHAPSFLETVLNMLKPVIKEKIRKRFHIFQGDHTNLYKFIPKEILPSDFGGNAPSIEESNRAWQQTIESMRDFFIEDTKRITDESKRPKDSPNRCNQMFGVNGTFNKLNID